jgi:hypothetical protein
MKIKYIVLLLIGSMVLLGCQSIVSSDGEQVSDPITEETTQPTMTESTSIEDGAEQSEQNDSINNEQSTESSVEGQSNMLSACYHPYFPIEAGAYWTYQQPDSEGYTMRIEETGENSFKMIQEMNNENTTFTVDWLCSENGLLRGSFGQMDMLNQSLAEEDAPEFEFETLEWEGNTLPSPELIQVGYTWTSDYKLSADLNLESLATTMEVIVKIQHEITAVEEVTVPAGTFPEAIRVESTGNIEMLMLMGETSNVLNNVDFNYTTWYVEGIGMVKSSDAYMGYTTGTELVESSFIE